MKMEWLWYFLLVAAGVTVATALTKDPTVAVIILAIEVNRFVVPLVVKGNTRLFGVLAWLCGVLVLVGLGYMVDLLLFPHSYWANRREQNAIPAAIIGMVLGFLGSYWMPAGRAKAVK